MVCRRRGRGGGRYLGGALVMSGSLALVEYSRRSSALRPRLITISIRPGILVGRRPAREPLDATVVSGICPAATAIGPSMPLSSIICSHLPQRAYQPGSIPSGFLTANEARVCTTPLAGHEECAAVHRSAVPSGSWHGDYDLVGLTTMFSVGMSFTPYGPLPASVLQD